MSMLICLRIAAPVAALVLVSSVCAQDRGEPPVAGDLLLELIGRHFANPTVAAMIAWSGCEPVSAGDVDAKSPPFELKLDRDRVCAVTIQHGPLGSDQGWSAALPGSLTWSTTPAQLAAKGPWRQEVPGQRFVARISKATGFDGQQIDGYEIVADFERAELRSVALRIQLNYYMKQYTKLVQEFLPASTFVSEAWPGLLGDDIATDTGALLAAWVGIPQLQIGASRAGLTLKLTDFRWIDRIGIGREFEGSRPFGLTVDARLADVRSAFGEPNRREGGAPGWRLLDAHRAPMSFFLGGHEGAHGIFRSAIVLTADRQETIRWESQVRREGAPTDAIAVGIAAAWMTLRDDPESLKGRRVVEQGFLGETVWWHSTQPLLHIIAGKVRESASYEAFKTRSVEYTLRIRPSGADRPLASELMEFAPTVELILGREWQYEPQMGADGQLTGLEWAPKEAASERSERGPRLRLDVRSAEGIEELVVTLSRPLD